MKQLLLIVALACGAMILIALPQDATAQSTNSAPAVAAVTSTAPTEAQIDELLDTMDLRRTLDEMFVQLESVTDTMGARMLGDDATPEQRESLRRISEKQHSAMRKTMSWETMAPIYRRVYARLFTADEVEAMIGFYGSGTGRGIMRKIPQAMQLSMEEMQPMIETMVADMQKTMQTELQGASEGKKDAN
jgi:uncharacterized protein